MEKLKSFVNANKLLLVIVIIAILLRFIGLIPNISHTDEAYIIKHSRQLFYNIIAHGDFDPHAYKYGSFIFYFQSVTYLPIFIIGLVLITLRLSSPPPSQLNIPALDFIEQVSNIFPKLFLWEGRALTAVIGVVSIIIVYLITKKLFNKKIALFSSFIFAINPFHVRDSHYITTDVPFLFFLLVSLLFMVNLLLTSKWKWYILSGFIIGISSTIRYFPLAALIYPIAVLMDIKKSRSWVLKVLMGVVFIPVGIFISIPFPFLSANSRNIFQQDIQAQFLWYGTTVTTFILSILSYIMTFGKTQIEPLSSLVPTKFTFFHSHFLLFEVFGPALLALALLGIVVSFVKFPIKTILLLIIPLANFIYISFYIPAVYERLSLPMIPFISIFVGIALFEIDKKREIIQLNYSFSAYFLFILSFSFFIFFPLSKSIKSSWSCGSNNVESVGARWIDKNISLDNKIAQIPPIIFPTKYNGHKISEFRPDTQFFLAELQQENFNYFLINTDLLTRFTYQFENNFFVIPKILYENYFIPLALKEYNSRAILMQKFSRENMCDKSKVYYYKIPNVILNAENLIKKYNFDNSIESWTLEDLGLNSKVTLSLNQTENHNFVSCKLSSNTSSCGNKSSAVEYNWSKLYYRGPRMLSEKIPVTPLARYTLSGWIKSGSKLNENERDGFFRIDFYNKKSDINLPGLSVAMTPRIHGRQEWKKVEVTAVAPKESEFLILSFNVMGTKNNGSFYIDNIEILGP